MTYYLKYRSKTIDELDLEGVRESLSNIIKSGNIPHAFLFSGPKGSGKTSAARIVAKVVNCEKPDTKTGEPCNKCANCLAITKGESLDVVEIDAASHRGIDDIRALRDAVKLAPAYAKKKVYIIDEAHMLTTEASNALLKTLEEPPNHVIFILATTNPEKLIETIRSRTVNIAFKKANKDEIVRSLTRVASGEKLKIDKVSLEVVASASDGSFRDAHKLLEELVIGNVKLDKPSVGEYLFKRKAFDPDNFIALLKGDNEKQVYQEIEKAVENGVSVKNITAEILDKLRGILLAKIGISGKDESDFTKGEILELIALFSRSYSQVGLAVLEQIPLELAVSEWFSKKSETTNPKSQIKNLKIESKRELVSEYNDKNNFSKNGLSSNESKEKAVESKIGEVQKADLENGFDDVVWTRILTEIKVNNTSTEALLRAAKPLGYDGKTLTLGVYYKFHKEKLETKPHRNILESVLQNVTGDGVRVICTLTEPPLRKPSENSSLPQASPNGSAVLVESETVLAEGEDEEIVRVAKEIFGN